MTKFEWFKHEWLRSKSILKNDNVVYLNGKNSHDVANDTIFELEMLALDFGMYDANGKIVGMRDFDLDTWRAQNSDIL